MIPIFFKQFPLANLGRDTSILNSIREPNVYLALWHRGVPPLVTTWINSWIKDYKLAFDQTLPVEGTSRALAVALLEAGCPEGSELAWMSEDVHRLVAIFAVIAEVPQVRIRLETVRDCGCEKFHVDTLELRLLCTYCGQGTQWVPAGSAMRDHLGADNGSTEEANSRIVPNSDSIQTMATGAVGLFKGRLLRGFENQALVHRSAPVCCKDDHRLRLCLDVPRFPRRD